MDVHNIIIFNTENERRRTVNKYFSNIVGENQFILNVPQRLKWIDHMISSIYLYMYNWENIIPNINIFIVTDIQSQKNNNKKLNMLTIKENDSWEYKYFNNVLIYKNQ